MNWKQYLAALLVFNALGFLFVWVVLMTQKWLPLNPANRQHVVAPGPEHGCQLHDEHELAELQRRESRASYFSQMAGLAVQNFLSAATGMAALLALMRGSGTGRRRAANAAHPEQGTPGQLLGGPDALHSSTSSYLFRSSSR